MSSLKKFSGGCQPTQKGYIPTWKLFMENNHVMFFYKNIIYIYCITLDIFRFCPLEDVKKCLLLNEALQKKATNDEKCVFSL